MKKSTVGLILIAVMWYVVGINRGIKHESRRHHKEYTCHRTDEGTDARPVAELEAATGQFLDSNPNIAFRPKMSGADKDFESLLDAIEWVESKGDQFAIGDNGEAVGAYQIHTIFVEDVNRIIGVEFFLNEDRFNWWYSRIMTGIYLKHYGGTLEDMARKHNGGPQGHLKEATKPYWEKVKERMEMSK